MVACWATAYLPSGCQRCSAAAETGRRGRAGRRLCTAASLSRPGSERPWSWPSTRWPWRRPGLRSCHRGLRGRRHTIITPIAAGAIQTSRQRAVNHVELAESMRRQEGRQFYSTGRFTAPRRVRLIVLYCPLVATRLCVCVSVCAWIRALTADAVGESVEVEAHGGAGETLQGAQGRQSAHGGAGAGARC